ncbi:hypothetical protein [Paraglaciecola arctica]|uniref:Uncharacterized protein n=1 Tax=Paraglaciecola arctica BSs20135 TaxID=493475 RepID=K6YPQ4_9ALTE|nr:hypothetical protein [Paraglaciecola arctica]GAC20157.1 hypothetical protein GARC_3198 [Paraglaciecola arctica BSs20135]
MSAALSVSVSVSEKFIGNPFDIEEVITGTSNCSAWFSQNQTYLVFENEKGYVSMCSMIELDYVPKLEGNLKALRTRSIFGI